MSFTLFSSKTKRFFCPSLKLLGNNSMRRRQRLGRVSGSPARPPVAVRPSRGICSSYKKSPAGRNSSKNVPRLLQAHGGCPLDAFACNKMKREPRGAAFPELRASCVPKLRASVPALKFRKNFDKHFKIFENSYPHPTFDQRSGAWLKLRGKTVTG